MLKLTRSSSSGLKGASSELLCDAGGLKKGSLRRLLAELSAAFAGWRVIGMASEF